MSVIEQRPRFKHLVPWSQEEVINRVEEAVASPDAPVTGHNVGHHIYLKIPTEQRHTWTPQLDIELEDHPEGGTLVRGLIGPTPAVWTRFVFLYAFSGAGILFGMITGMPQWMLNKTPVGLWVMFVSMAMTLGVYLLAQSGKRLGSEHTEILRNFWREIVDEVATKVDDHYTIPS